MGNASWVTSLNQNVIFNQVAVGDDTWDALFGDVLGVSIPYDSFNVEDLDSADDGVREVTLDDVTGREG